MSRNANEYNVRNAYNINKNGLEHGADKHKDTGTQYNSRCNLLDKLQTSSPQHWKGNHDEVDICDYARGKCDPDDRLRHCSLAEIWKKTCVSRVLEDNIGRLATGVGINLPISLEWPTCCIDRQDRSDECCRNKGNAGIDSDTISSPKTFLLPLLMVVPR